MPTICARCTHLIVPEGGRSAFWKWMCAANKVAPIFNPVTGKDDAAPPYRLCKFVNTEGACPDFDPGPTILFPRADPDGVVAA